MLFIKKRPGIIEEIPRIQRIVAQVFIRRTMQLVAAGFGDDVDLTAARASERRIGIRGNDAEFLKRYRSYAGDGVFRLSVGIENADDLIAELARVLD